MFGALRCRGSFAALGGGTGGRGLMLRAEAKDGVAPKPAPQPAFGAGGHGASIGMAGSVAPGTLVLAFVFLTSFVLYYFVNWKYLSTVWPLS